MEDVAEEETQQLEYTVDGTQAQTSAPGRSMWSDFTCAVRDLPAVEGGGGMGEAGWVQSKRERGGHGDIDALKVTQRKQADTTNYVNLYLNLPPEN